MGAGKLIHRDSALVQVVTMYWKKYIGATPGSPEELESANPIRHTVWNCMQ